MFRKFLVLVSAATLSVAAHAADRKEVKLDGSSTVYPISEAIAEEFGKVKANRNIRVTVGVSGTGGGFKKFIKKEIDIGGASRPVKEKEAKPLAQKNIKFIELPVAFDGLSVIINKKNTWVDSLSIAELNAIWKPGSTVKKWSDIRPNWPNKAIKLYGPGGDSGTFEYFTKKVNGKAMVSRADYTASEDDNVLVYGISGDKYSLGYFGYGYYAANKSKLKLVPISSEKTGGKAILPSPKTIESGAYKPLSRPVFIYVNRDSAKKPEVKKFVDFYLDNAPKLSAEVGYVPFPKSTYTKVKKRWNALETGSAYTGNKKIKNVLK
ncbi:MAG: PstS family phosphate ABC transporter substrate-binding protein [Pseudomonadota bacterium]